MDEKENVMPTPINLPYPPHPPPYPSSTTIYSWPPTHPSPSLILSSALGGHAGSSLYQLAITRACPWIAGMIMGRHSWQVKTMKFWSWAQVCDVGMRSHFSLLPSIVGRDTLIPTTEYPYRHVVKDNAYVSITKTHN